MLKVCSNRSDTSPLKMYRLCLTGNFQNLFFTFLTMIMFHKIVVRKSAKNINSWWDPPYIYFGTLLSVKPCFSKLFWEISNFTVFALRPQKVSGVWLSAGYKIGAVTRFFLISFLGNLKQIFCQQGNTSYMYTRGPNFRYTKNGGKERPRKSGKRSYPYVKKSFKTQHGRISIDPSNFGRNSTSFQRAR